MPFVAILVGCKGKASCKADVDELMSFLRGMDHSMPLVWDDDFHVVQRPDLPRKEPHTGKVVYVAKTVRMFGAEVPLAELEERLAIEHHKVEEDIKYGHFSRGNPPDPGEVTLVIDAAATWDTVVHVTDAAVAAGFAHPAIAFGVPVTGKPPPRQPVDDKIDEIKNMPDASNKAAALAKLMTGIVKDCKALQRSFGRVSAVEGEDKAQVLIDEMGPALLECNCDVDIPALRNVFFAVANNSHPTTVIHLDLTKGGKQIALPAATPWSEASKQLADSAAVWLAIQ